MARLSSLPERLCYLQPFRRKFKSRPPEELNEESGAEPLIKILGKRIADLSTEEAENTLHLDMKALEEWLDQPENQNDCLQFVRGFFMVGTATEMVQTIREELEKFSKPPPDIVMEVPPKAKARFAKTKEESGAIVRLKGMIMALDVIPEERVNRWAEWERESSAGELTITSVTFGPVQGEKFTRISKLERHTWKDVQYLLNVPGGNISVAIAKPGNEDGQWDETQFEAFFHTLRVV